MNYLLRFSEDHSLEILRIAKMRGYNGSYWMTRGILPHELLITNIEEDEFIIFRLLVSVPFTYKITTDNDIKYVR